MALFPQKLLGKNIMIYKQKTEKTHIL